MEIEEFVEEKVDVESENLRQLMEKVEPLVSSVSLEWIKEETLVLVVRTKSEFTKIPLLGKSMEGYVLLATSVCKQRFVEGEDKVFASLLKYRDEAKQIAVFYDDTPLLEKATFFEIMQYFASKKMNFWPLKRGFVIKSDYIENFESILSTPLDHFGHDDFFVMDSAKAVGYAYHVLNKRINNFHKSQGVVLFGENTIFIDADVQIESGVIIYPNNQILGNSVLCKGVVLGSGNVIDNSIILDDAELNMCYLKNSKVPEGKVLNNEKLISETL